MNGISSVDTLWVLIATAFVMIMTPALAFFYGGMVRQKNVLGTSLQSFVAIGLVSIIWILWGYSLSFGPDINGLIGNLDWFALKGISSSEAGPYSKTIPHLIYMAFQMKFAIITPALITGAFAERFKFKTYLIFVTLWVTFVYCPLAHWVWGTGGWIATKLGALDFAGGLVVHISSGAAALAAALVVGRRKDYLKKPLPPHNLTLTLIGTALLWFGWFGFNAGSSLSVGPLAVHAFITTHIASSAALLSWMFVEWKHSGRPTVLGAASGAVAGLVAITPAAGYVTIIASLVIGLLAGAICYAAINLKHWLKFDDSLDAFGVHGVGGTFGAIATGLWATTSVNAAGQNGLFHGNASLLWAQLGSVFIAWAFSFTATVVILKFLDAFVGLRIHHEDEDIGLDLGQHGERGYTSY